MSWLMGNERFFIDRAPASSTGLAERGRVFMEVSHEVREQRRRAVIEQELADARTLREVDTMLAFEAFEQAASALADVVNRGLAHPEYRVRLFCVENRLGNTVHAGAEEELRRVLLTGPASDNLIRALEIGRSLLPGVSRGTVHAEKVY